MASLRVLNVNYILPSSQHYPPPGETVPLSFFDTSCAIIPQPIRRFFLYPESDGGLSFPSLLQSLKSSLSETLLLFHPLAGKLTSHPTSGDAIVDCSPAAVGEGVAFIEAESDADFRRLASDETHDVEAFLQLVPELDVRALPAPALVVQVTRFTGGGLAIAFAAHHAVVDGRAVSRFMQAWSQACKRGGPLAIHPPPSHDRSVIRHPNRDQLATHYWKQLDPAHPQTTAPSPPITRRTFIIDAKSIKSLKESGRESGGQDPAPQPSTFVAVSAHAWISIVHAKGIKDDATTTIGFTADCRARLDPPLEEGYTGNCVKVCFAKATGSELRGEGGLARACSVITQAIREFVKEPLRGCEDWIGEYVGHALLQNMSVVGSPRFSMYEIDFGWGRPSRVELVPWNKDGMVVLVGGRVEGEVQVCVSLSPLQMDAFASAFSVGLGD